MKVARWRKLPSASVGRLDMNEASTIRRLNTGVEQLRGMSPFERFRYDDLVLDDDGGVNVFASMQLLFTLSNTRSDWHSLALIMSYDASTSLLSSFEYS